MVYLAGQILVFVLAAMLVGAALAWFFLIGPLRRDRAAGRPADGGSTAAGPAVGADPAVSEAAVADLTVRLRRQEDEWALERADLTARLATAEQQAGESERRVAAAEHQVAEAERRVGDIERQLRAVAVPDPTGNDDSGELGPDGGPSSAPGASRPATSVADLAQEAHRLRDALADAEGRAAKFSSRLAMVRTEAEDAQRQVATMITRLDRHQAEWAAEKVRLLARIDDVEAPPSAGRRSPATSAPRSAAHLDTAHLDAARADAARAEIDDSRCAEESRDEASRGEHARDEGTVDDAAVTGALASPNGAAESNALVRAEAEADDLVPVGRVSVEALAPAAAAASPYPRTSALDAVVFSAGARRPLPGSDVLAGFVTTLRPSTVAADRPDPVGVVPSARDTGRRRELTRQDLARRSGDNLKEIVGIGPLVETRLHNLGITSFRQLAMMGDADVHRLATMLDGLGDRIVSDDWVGQARDLQASRYGGLS